MKPEAQPRPSLFKLLTTKEGFNYYRERYGRKFLIGFGIWFVTKWTLTIIFGKEIIEWFQRIF